VIDVSQGDAVYFLAGAAGDALSIRAFDGAAWSAPDGGSWAPVSISVLPDSLPSIATAGTVTAQRNQILALSGLFTVSDADGDTMTRYQLWDSNRDPNSGHWVVNGAAQPAGAVIDITAAQMAQTSFVAGKISDSLQIRAFDGIGWSAADNAAWSTFSVTVPANNAPVMTSPDVSRAHFQTLAMSSLFSVSDPDGDTITEYQLWDSSRDPNSGHFVVGGAAQAAGTVIDIAAAQLVQTTFVTGAASDNLQIRAYDGIGWSAPDNAGWSPFTVSVPTYTLPSLTTQDVNATPGQALVLSSLFSVSDADGDTITAYQLWDSTRDLNSGHFVVNNAAQAAGTVIDITASQLAQTWFVAGAISDSLQIRAFDGAGWSAANNAVWSPFHIVTG
jgi:hypothetical protein